MENLAFSRTLKAVAAVLVASAMTAPVAMAQTRSCVDTLAAMPEFQRFMNGVVHTHLVQDLRNAQNITVFAPVNAAVDRMDPGTRERLLPRNADGQRSAGSGAQTAIASHVIQGRHDSRELARGQQFSTYGGTQIASANEGGALVIKGGGNTEARVVMPDIACSNGVIHGIDALLVR